MNNLNIDIGEINKLDYGTNYLRLVISDAGIGFNVKKH